MPDCDAMVTDVSSVGLDWLYLRTDKPIFITDRHHDAERLRAEVPVSRCADVIDDVDVADLTALIACPPRERRAPPGPGGHAPPLLRRPPGRRRAPCRFIDAVSELVALRDQLLRSAPSLNEEGASITA